MFLSTALGFVPV